MEPNHEPASPPSFRRRLWGFDRTQVQAHLQQLETEAEAAAASASAADDPHELLDRAKQLAADVVQEAHRRADTIVAEAEAEAETRRVEGRGAADVGTEPETGVEASRSPDWGALTDQIMAILLTAEREAEGRILQAQAEADSILGNANEEANRIRVRASTEAAGIADAAQADLAHARARREGAEAEANEILAAAENEAASRWRQADAELRALASTRLASTMDHVQAVRADLAGMVDDVRGLESLLTSAAAIGGGDQPDRTRDGLMVPTPVPPIDGASTTAGP